MTYQNAVDYLLNIPRFSKKTSHDNLRELLHRMGNPQDKMKVVHVAGTNGKGSVCAFLNTLLTGVGKKVGLFTSPHLVKINERMKINGEQVTDEEFLEIFLEIQTLVEKMQKEGLAHPSFFEYLFLMAVRLFEKNSVEYGIFEVGLGGRLDATNVITKPEVSVITSISLDHTEILGETLEEIAVEKGGIIKADVPVVFYRVNETVAGVIEKIAEEKKTHIYEVRDEEIKINEISSKKIDFSLDNRYYKCGNVTVNFPATYQAINGSLALLAFEVLKRKDETIEDMEHAELLMKDTRWEGRMEQVRENIYLDGAHNLSGIAEFLKSVRNMDSEGRKLLLFSVVVEKDYEHMIEQLVREPLWGEIFVAQMDNYRAVSKEEIQKVFYKYTDTPVHVFSQVQDAFDAALSEKQNKDILFCAGSLYLIGELKGYLEVKND